MSDVVIRDCRHPACGTKIVFVTTTKGHEMPVDLASLKCSACTVTYGEHGSADHHFRVATLYDGKLMVSHFATCKNSREFRRQQRRAR